MGTLTKISIVVLVVLVLLAVPVFITKAVIDPNYRLAYEAEVKTSRLNAQAAEQARLAAKVIVRRAAKAELALADVRSKMRSAADRFVVESATAQGQLLDQKVTNERFKAQLGILSAALKQESDLRAKDTESLKKFRQDNETLSQVNIRLSEMLKQKEAEVDRANMVAQMVRERNVSLTDRIKELESLVAGGGQAVPGEAVTVVSDTNIVGTLSAVRGDLGKINIGSAKGVKPGMRFYVYRDRDGGSLFVGYLRVQDVDVDESAGTIIDTQLAPKQGDKVATRLD